MGRTLFTSLVFLLIAGGPVAAEPAAPAESPVPASFKQTFTGTIGKRPVIIALARDGRRLTGRYRYVPAQTYIYEREEGLYLAGPIDQSGRFTLKEEGTDDDGKDVVSGKLVGRVSRGPAPEGVLVLEGTWSRPNGSRALPLVAQERRPTAAQARIAIVELPQRDRVWKKIIKAAYPEVRDAAGADQTFNTAARRFVEAAVKSYKDAVSPLVEEDIHRLLYEQIPEVRYADDRIISIRFAIDYDCAAAHPNREVRGYVFNRATGKRMKLSELFLPGSHYRKVLSAKIAEAGPGFHQGAPNWHLDDLGLWFAFVDQPVGDFSEAFIPWSELRALIDPAGPAGKLVPQEQSR